MNIYQLLCGILFSTKHRTMKKTHKTKIPAFIDMTPYSGDITEIYTECVNKGDHFQPNYWYYWPYAILKFSEVLNLKTKGPKGIEMKPRLGAVYGRFEMNANF